MIYSERLKVFLHAMEGPDGLSEGRPCSASAGERRRFALFRRQQEEAGIPIIRKEMESFLKVLLELKRPERILEIGAAEGFSALWMAACTDSSCHITTIEQDPDRCRRAREHFQKSMQAGRISLTEGDAQQVLPALACASFDFVFMDAAKGQYIHYLPRVLDLMKKGALLVSDNVLQDGAILEAPSVLGPDERTICVRMRAYLRALKQTEGLVTTIVPIGDGAAVTVKREDVCIHEGDFLNC